MRQQFVEDLNCVIIKSILMKIFRLVHTDWITNNCNTCEKSYYV